MAKSFKELVRKTGNKKTKTIAKNRTIELLKQIKSNKKDVAEFILKYLKNK